MELSAQQIVNKLIPLMEIRMIYRSGIQQEFYLQPVFIILLDKDGTALSPELRTTVDKIFREENEYCLYRVFAYEYTAQQLKEENLFFVYGLRKENLVYRKPGIPGDPFPGIPVNEALFSRVKDRLKQEFTKTDHFWEGATFCLEDEDLRQAALMFHQHMEYVFRIIELFVMGKEMESHSIREHQTYVDDCVPELGGVFFAEIENEQKVLDLLDEVYIAVTHSNNYHINQEQIDVIKSKAEWTANAARKVINRQYHALELKRLAPSAMVHKESDTQNDPNNAAKETEKDPLLEQVIELLKSKTDLHSLYLIGKQNKISSRETYVTPTGKGHEQSVAYTLLMVTHSPLPIPLFELTDDIYNRLPCRVYIIDYTLDEVCYKVDRGSNFLDRFLTEALLLFAEDKRLTSLNRTPDYHGKNWKRMRKVWKARSKRATYLLSMLVDAYQEMDEDPTVKMGIMHYALEQVCLGLLYVFWEFKPAHNTLSFLFHLCNHFTSLPDDIFSGASHTRHHMYHLLSNAPHQMRFKSKSGITKKEAEKAFVLCNDFMVQARKVAEAELQRLKRLHCVEAVV
ncbi:hypothetical protein ED312_11185 [Sinomicrobium pectinilyticum]|uniref:HEPN domain-containing protein n=1 Tax=Sinomicrobium pectinilyticum TaxID=1084421 RepID=A0A3N0EG77_SINP1|nr:hypothetical protein [Sinomicrobium pectinilyticum]RNL86689.1 hypothetical protein ED312_11185 [Sinomicrobium pectinilyticum]